jgi:hypothetical protein
MSECISTVWCGVVWFCSQFSQTELAQDALHLPTSVNVFLNFWAL